MKKFRTVSPRAWSVMVVLIVVFAVGSGVVSLWRLNDGNRLLSGNLDTEFVKQKDANAAYDQVLQALDITPGRVPITVVRPGYMWSPPLLSHDWWKFVTGYMEAQYTRVPISDKSLAERNKSFQALGYGAVEHVRDSAEVNANNLEEMLQYAADERSEHLEDNNQQAAVDYCLRSPECQQRHDQIARELNDKPLEFALTTDGGPYGVTMTYQIYPGDQTGDLKVRMDYSCYTGLYCPDKK